MPEFRLEDGIIGAKFTIFCVSKKCHAFARAASEGGPSADGLVRRKILPKSFLSFPKTGTWSAYEFLDRTRYISKISSSVSSLSGSYRG